MRTITGRKVYVDKMTPQDVDIVDIAHSLAMQCRFNGHVPEHYSVAQHSVLVSKMCPPEYALQAVLHDAAEAYCSDVISPIKHLPAIEAAFAPLEFYIARQIEKKFLVQLTPYDIEVKQADHLVTLMERRDVAMHDLDDDEYAQLDSNVRIKRCLSAREAFDEFLDRFHDLKKGN